MAATKEGATRLHRSAMRKARPNPFHALIYTDGSGIQGHVGAAAWCPAAGRGKTAYMGDLARSAVYTAELVGIELAFQIAQELQGWKRVTILTDNQAAIYAVTNPTTTSGFYITQRVIHEIEKTRRMGIKPTLQWVPAHIGTEGNESVDNMAKGAAGWDRRTDTVQEGLRATTYDILTLGSAKKMAVRQRFAR